MNFLLKWEIFSFLLLYFGQHIRYISDWSERGYNTHANQNYHIRNIEKNTCELVICSHFDDASVFWACFCSLHYIEKEKDKQITVSFWALLIGCLKVKIWCILLCCCGISQITVMKYNIFVEVKRLFLFLDLLKNNFV